MSHLNDAEQTILNAGSLNKSNSGDVIDIRMFSDEVPLIDPKVYLKQLFEISNSPDGNKKIYTLKDARFLNRNIDEQQWEKLSVDELLTFYFTSMYEPNTKLFVAMEAIKTLQLSKPNENKICFPKAFSGKNNKNSNGPFEYLILHNIFVQKEVVGKQNFSYLMFKMPYEIVNEIKFNWESDDDISLKNINIENLRLSDKVSFSAKPCCKILNHQNHSELNGELTNNAQYRYAIVKLLTLKLYSRKTDEINATNEEDYTAFIKVEPILFLG